MDLYEGWWTEARNADERSGMQARGTKQRELVEDTPRELLWIESRSLVRDFWSAVEYGGITEFLGRGHALMAKWGQDVLLEKNRKQRDFIHYQAVCSGSGNGCWNCVSDGSRKQVQQVMQFHGILDHLVYMRRNLTSHRPCERKQQL